MTQTRHLTAVVSKSPTNGSGIFEALAYDRSERDVDGITLTESAMRGAVATFQRRGRPLVLRWGHDMKDPTAAIGVIDRMWTDGVRLYVGGRFDLTHDEGVAIYERVLVGTINELSVSWTAPSDATYVRDGIEYVTAMEIIEVSFVAAGANRGTRVLTIRSAPDDGDRELRDYEQLVRDLQEVGATDDQIATATNIFWSYQGPSSGPAADVSEVVRWRQSDPELAKRFDELILDDGRTRLPKETTVEFRARMLREFGDDDITRRALGIKTEAELEAEAAAALNAAYIKLQRLAPPRPTRVLVDARMRPL